MIEWCWTPEAVLEVGILCCALAISLISIVMMAVVYVKETE